MAEINDVVLNAATNYVMAAASDNLMLARWTADQFAAAYNICINTRNLDDNAVAYCYARAYINAKKAGAVFVDAPPDLLQDGFHRPFAARRRSF